MNKKVVAILFGGRSSEHEISKISAATVMSAMSADKYFVLPVYITKDGRWLLYDGHIDNYKNVQWEKLGTPAVLSPDASQRGLLRIVGEKFKLIPIDAVFPVLHGQNGEDGSIQGLCELADIPYVGAGVLASAMCMDKVMTKALVKSIGDINQTPYLVFSRNDLEDMDETAKKVRYKLGYPCFVKPANTGSSLGISKASNKKQLVAALKHASKFDRKILVEKAVFGREFEVSVLGNDEVFVSGVGEIKAAAEFYDFDAKYNNAKSQTIVPAEISADIAEEIRKAAAEIYRAADCAGMARVDFFLEDLTDKVIFNEINTIPGFTSISMFSMLLEASGVSMPDLVDKLIELAIERNG